MENIIRFETVGKMVRYRKFLETIRGIEIGNSGKMPPWERQKFSNKFSYYLEIFVSDKDILRQSLYLSQNARTAMDGQIIQEKFYTSELTGRKRKWPCKYVLTMSITPAYGQQRNFERLQVFWNEREKQFSLDIPKDADCSQSLPHSASTADNFQNHVDWQAGFDYLYLTFYTTEIYKDKKPCK